MRETQRTPSAASVSSASGNLFDDLPERADDEVFEMLFNNSSVQIERISSLGHASPPDFWYEQNDDEWVMVVRGTAQLCFPDDQVRELRAGDWLVIPAGCRHRVASTDENTLWLAVHATAHHTDTNTG